MARHRKRRHHRRHHAHRSHARRHHRKHRRISAHQHRFGAKGKHAFDSCLKKVANGDVSPTRAGWAGCFRKAFKSG